MNRYKQLYVWGLLLVLTLFGTIAYAATTLEQIEDHYRQGRIEEAYKLANQYLPEGEGDPAFDYLYGIIAIDSGDLSMGVFALERVLMVKPTHHFAQLELARGYYLLGQADRAKEEFEQVLEANPSAAIRSKIAQYLKAVKVKQSAYQTTVNAYSEFTLGYDTNINSASSEATFTTPTLGTGTLSEESLSEDSPFGEIEVGALVNKPIAEGRFLFSGVDLSQRVHTRGDDYDLTSLKLHGGYRLTESDRSLRFSANLQHLGLEYDFYRTTAYLTADGQYLLSPNTRVNGYLQGGVIAYDKLDSRDVYTMSAGVGLAHALNTRSKPIFSALLYVGQDEPMESNQTSKEVAEKENIGLILSNRFSLSNGGQMDFSVLWQNSDYQGVDSVFLVKRSDDYFKMSIGYTHQLSNDWKLKVAASQSRLSSNISLYEYDRSEFSVGVRYEY